MIFFFSFHNLGIKCNSVNERDLSLLTSYALDSQGGKLLRGTIRV